MATCPLVFQHLFPSLGAQAGAQEACPKQGSSLGLGPACSPERHTQEVGCRVWG